MHVDRATGSICRQARKTPLYIIYAASWLCAYNCGMSPVHQLGVQTFAVKIIYRKF